MVVCAAAAAGTKVVATTVASMTNLVVGIIVLKVKLALVIRNPIVQDSYTLNAKISK